VWKDTLWVKSLALQVPYPQGVYTIVVRTRYERYIGEYVLHCHILDHEDQGMMQNVRHRPARRERRDYPHPSLMPVRRSVARRWIARSRDAPVGPGAAAFRSDRLHRPGERDEGEGSGAERRGSEEQLALADGDDSLTCLLRRSNDGTSWALTVINPDPHARHEAALDGIDVDLGAATEVTPGREGARVGEGNRLSVEPGEVRVLASM
jgi:multicopper oxidase